MRRRSKPNSSLHKQEDSKNTTEQLEMMWLYRRHQRALRQIVQRKSHLNRQVARVMVSGNFSQVVELYHRHCELQASEALLNQLLPGPPESVHRFVFSSAMLRESHAYCTQTADEWLHFIVGIEWDGVVIGTRILTFPYDQQSKAGALANHAATHKALIETSESGLQLVAIIHSHPGQWNHHSATDTATHRSYEVCFDCIGGIWNRSGEIRFFSDALPFHVEVVGSDLRKVDDHVFQLEETSMAV